MNKEEIEELAFKDRKELANLNELDLLEIIEFLQLDRKQWINQYSTAHNDYVDLQQENKKLKMINEEYERLNKEKYRGFKIIDVQEYDRYELLSYKNYKDNWNKLKEYLENKIDEYSINLEYLSTERMIQIKNKMQELEKGSDNNE